jgi:hypothetical protein
MTAHFSNVVPLHGRDKYTVKISHVQTKHDQFITVYATGLQDALALAMSKHFKYRKGLSVAEQMSWFSSQGFYVYEPVKETPRNNRTKDRDRYSIGISGR